GRTHPRRQHPVAGSVDLAAKKSSRTRAQAPERQCAGRASGGRPTFRVESTTSINIMTVASTRAGARPRQTRSGTPRPRQGSHRRRHRTVDDPCPAAQRAPGEEATGADVYGPRPAAHSPRARRGRYLNGSFTTTLTPEMTPVAALRTCSTASW